MNNIMSMLRTIYNAFESIEIIEFEEITNLLRNI